MVTRLILAIISKCIEILHCDIVHQEYHSVVGQLYLKHKQNKQTHKEIRSVVTRGGEWREED